MENIKIQEAMGEIEIPMETLANSLMELDRLGGFDLLESFIDGIQNVNPHRKARKRIFMEDSSKKEEREALMKAITIWLEMLLENPSPADIALSGQEKLDEVEKLLHKNLYAAVEASRKLEASYRSVSLFYKNANAYSVKNVSFLNAGLDQLSDLDNPKFIDAVKEELQQSYDRLDLRSNYGLLIVPGYLRSRKVIDKWARIAHQNKVMLLTDFQDLDSAEDVMDLFEEAGLTGDEEIFSNVAMSCNWFVGREAIHEIGEAEELRVPPAAALGGKIHATLVSQALAGSKFGGISDVTDVAFDMRKSEIAALEKIGLIPMVKEYGKVMAFSVKTIYTGENLGLQTYSAVRAMDHISKVLMDLLNRRAFENFNASVRKNLTQNIGQFLDSITGSDNVIENFSIRRFEQDAIQKDLIYLDVHLKLYFPAKFFLLKIDGIKDDYDSVTWTTKYEMLK